ncbi:MAG: TIR domain-containing protein [Lachnospiraceae bacterium]|nr:TIR domain-containing protein [Lachnospiraceae bacterium]
MSTDRDAIKPCNTEKPYIFVSYSKQDAERVYPFILRLQSFGCNLWIDKELHRMVGSNWQKNVLAAMADPGCRGLLFMVSRDSLTSAAVFAELALSQQSRKVLHRHAGCSLKIIPVNADRSWSPSRLGIKEWITGVVSQDSRPLSADDYDCLNVGAILERYYLSDSLERLEYCGEIASCILDDILKPVGGSKITLASIEEVDTVLENIDKDCFANGLPKGQPQLRKAAEGDSAPQSPQPAGNVSPAPQSPEETSRAASSPVPDLVCKVYASGNIYEGQMKDGKRHGQGRYTLVNGDVYEGSFRNNRFEGHGVYRFAGGDVLDAEWHDGRPVLKDGLS